METRTSHTFKLAPKDMIATIRHDDGSVAILSVIVGGFSIHLLPSHLPVLREAVALLEAIEAQAKPGDEEVAA